MSLADIVSVTITTATRTPSRIGFGTPLIFGYHTKFAERARVYTSVADMVTDGFATTDQYYAAAAAFFAQNPKVRQIIIGRCASAMTQIVHLTPVLVNSHLYSVTLNGVAFTYQADGSATAQEIVEGLTTAINAGSEPVTATEDNIKLILTADVAGTGFKVVTDRAYLTQATVTADAGIVADLTAIGLYNNDWYSCHPISQGATEVALLAAYVEGLNKIMVVSNGDDVIPAGTGLGATLKAASYARTALLYHPVPGSYPECAWAGQLLPLDAGSATWKFKELAGIATTVLTETEKNNMDADYVNYYTTEGGLDLTFQGYGADGTFLDVTGGLDFITSRLQEEVLYVLANAKKVPYTDAGVALLQAAVQGVLMLGVDQGIFAASPAPVVYVPLVADVSSIDRANRLLPDVEFTATLAGAVHSVEVSGTVSV